MADPTMTAREAALEEAAVACERLGQNFTRNNWRLLAEANTAKACAQAIRALAATAHKIRPTGEAVGGEPVAWRWTYHVPRGKDAIWHFGPDNPEAKEHPVFGKPLNIQPLYTHPAPEATTSEVVGGDAAARVLRMWAIKGAGWHPSIADCRKILAEIATHPAPDALHGPTVEVEWSADGHGYPKILSLTDESFTLKQCAILMATHGWEMRWTVDDYDWEGSENFASALAGLKASPLESDGFKLCGAYDTEDGEITRLYARALTRPTPAPVSEPDALPPTEQERHMMQTLDASLPAVRAALRNLEARGLVTPAPAVVTRQPHASDMTTDAIKRELSARDREIEQFHADMEESGGASGSPGEGLYERVNELETELKRRLASASAPAPAVGDVTGEDAP